VEPELVAAQPDTRGMVNGAGMLALVPEIAKTVSWVTRSFAFASRASTRGGGLLGFALDRSLCDSLRYNNHTLLVK